MGIQQWLSDRQAKAEQPWQDAADSLGLDLAFERRKGVLSLGPPHLSGRVEGFPVDVRMVYRSSGGEIGGGSWYTEFRVKLRGLKGLAIHQAGLGHSLGTHLEARTKTGDETFDRSLCVISPTAFLRLDEALKDLLMKLCHDRNLQVKSGELTEVFGAEVFGGKMSPHEVVAHTREMVDLAKLLTAAASVTV